MEKKYNHYIPRCLLKRWVTNNGEYDGVYVLDLRKKEIYFSSSSGKKAYSFAIFDNLYILSQNEERKKNLENWFGGLENTLSIFIDKISKKETDIFKNLKQLQRLVMGLVSFQFRSRYFIELGIQYFDSHPEIKKEFGEKSNLQILLENVVNATTDYSLQFFPIEFTVWYSNAPILLCDRPLLFEFLDGTSFLPITPNSILTFKKTKGTSSISFENIHEEAFKTFNQMIIQNARDWIVSTDKNSLERIIKDNQIQEYKDEVFIDNFKILTYGYEY